MESIVLVVITIHITISFIFCHERLLYSRIIIWLLCLRIQINEFCDYIGEFSRLPLNSFSSSVTKLFSGSLLMSSLDGIWAIWFSPMFFDSSWIQVSTSRHRKVRVECREIHFDSSTYCNNPSPTYLMTESSSTSLIVRTLENGEQILLFLPVVRMSINGAACASDALTSVERTLMIHSTKKFIHLFPIIQNPSANLALTGMTNEIFRPCIANCTPILHFAQVVLHTGCRGPCFQLI